MTALNPTRTTYPDATITSPSGQRFSINQKVRVELPMSHPIIATIEGYVDGDWSLDATDLDTAWFILNNGYYVRPSYITTVAADMPLTPHKQLKQSFATG